MLALIESLALAHTENAKQVRGKDGSMGRFVTINGRVVFIINSTPDSELTDKPKILPSEKTVETRRKKDGSEVSKTVYSDSWFKRSSAHKYTKVSHILKNRAKIEGSLRDSLENGYDSSGSLTREGVTAALALAVVQSGMRPGSPGQGTKDKGVAREHFKKTGKEKFFRTFGATTLLNKHTKVSGDTVTFRYLGKSGVRRFVTVKDADVAKAVNSLLEQGGPPSGYLWDNGSGRVSAPSLGRRFSRINPRYQTKDMRTAVANLVASGAVAKILDGKKQSIPSDKKKARALAKSLEKKIGVSVSAQLGNEPEVALRNYTNPMLIEHMLRQYGFSSDLLEDQAKVEALKAASSEIDMSKMPILMALHGEDAVREWASAAINDRDDAEDADIETNLLEP